MMANWFIAPLQSAIGIVHRLLIFLKAKYGILKTASSEGNIAELILKSRRVVPKKLLEAGFNFKFETWQKAARNLCG
jgi:NAD dependent epimerase/dehydratase family enzyme